MHKIAVNQAVIAEKSVKAAELRMQMQKSRVCVCRERVQRFESMSSVAGMLK